MRYLAQFWRTIVNTRSSIGRPLLLSAFYDSLFYVGTFLSLLAWNRLLLIGNQSIQIRGSLDLQDAMVNVTAEKIGDLMLLVVGSLTALLLVISLLYAYLKGMAWLSLKGRHMSFKLLKRLSMLMISWFFAWALIILIMPVFFTPAVGAAVLLILAFLAVHLSTILLAQVVTSGSTARAVRSAWQIGIRSMHHFILPYMAVIIGFLIISLAGWGFTPLPETIGFTLFLALIVAYLALVRSYLLNVVGTVQKRGSR
jgi:hypothetical protein